MRGGVRGQLGLWGLGVWGRGLEGRCGRDWRRGITPTESLSGIPNNPWGQQREEAPRRLREGRVPDVTGQLLQKQPRDGRRKEGWSPASWWKGQWEEGTP